MAYWSISTGLRSEGKSLSAVTDFLNFGMATVATVYQGLSAARDVLATIRPSSRRWRSRARTATRCRARSPCSKCGGRTLVVADGEMLVIGRKLETQGNQQDARRAAAA